MFCVSAFLNALLLFKCCDANKSSCSLICLLKLSSTRALNSDGTVSNNAFIGSLIFLLYKATCSATVISTFALSSDNNFSSFSICFALIAN